MLLPCAVVPLPGMSFPQISTWPLSQLSCLRLEFTSSVRFALGHPTSACKPDSNNSSLLYGCGELVLVAPAVGAMDFSFTNILYILFTYHVLLSVPPTKVQLHFNFLFGILSNL